MLFLGTFELVLEVVNALLIPLQVHIQVFLIELANLIFVNIIIAFVIDTY